MPRRLSGKLESDKITGTFLPGPRYIRIPQYRSHGRTPNQRRMIMAKSFVRFSLAMIAVKKK
jgi:hypothetical protein